MLSKRKKRKKVFCSSTKTELRVRDTPSHCLLHERPCLIVMPHLYQKEILFRAHDSVGHQGIIKVVARIPVRQKCSGIRRSVGQYVSQYLSCQQVRDKPDTFASN